MLNRDSLTERTAEQRGDRWREGNLRNEQQDTSTTLAHGVCKPQIELRLAAAGDAVQQGDVERARPGPRFQMCKGVGLLAGEHDRRPRDHWHRRGLFERIPLGRAPADRHQAERFEPLHCRGSNAACCQFRGVDAIRHTSQGIDRLGLPLAECRNVFMPLRGERGHADGAKCGRRSFQGTRDLHEAVAVERRQRGIGARPDGDGIHSVRFVITQCSEDLGAEAALVRRDVTSSLADPDVPFAFDPGARRHRRRERLAGAARVVLGHPVGEPEDVGRKKGSVVENVDDILDVSGAGVLVSRVAGHLLAAHHHPGQDPLAERNENARAGNRKRKRVGNAIRQRVERRHGHGDVNEPHRLATPCRRRRREARCVPSGPALASNRPRRTSSGRGFSTGTTDGRSGSASRRDSRALVRAVARSAVRI